MLTARLHRATQDSSSPPTLGLVRRRRTKIPRPSETCAPPLPHHPFKVSQNSFSHLPKRICLSIHPASHVSSLWRGMTQEKQPTPSSRFTEQFMPLSPGCVARSPRAMVSFVHNKVSKTAAKVSPVRQKKRQAKNWRTIRTSVREQKKHHAHEQRNAGDPQSPPVFLLDKPVSLSASIDSAR